MAGRRRIRLVVGILIFIITAVIYSRKAQVETYRDYVTEKVVGGGAVLRPGSQPEAQEAPAMPMPMPMPMPTSTVAAAAPTTTSRAPSGGGIQSLLTQTSTTTRYRGSISVPSYLDGSFTNHILDGASTHAPLADVNKDAAVGLPPITADDELGYELGEGRVDNDGPLISASTTIYWSKQLEHFPIATTLQLPTESSKALPRIQYAGKDAGKADVERLAIIKAAAQHAWDGYKGVAFGMDEVKPVSGAHNNPFNGWGATLVDTLDTLWILGMMSDFEEAVDFVRKIDFTTSIRPDVPLFETTIRYLGGLIAAYEVSDAKYRILLDKAVELAEVLYGAFDTPNRMPLLFYRWKPAFASQPHRASNKVVMSEIGSLSVEFTRLSQLTGESKYYDAISRITDALQEWQNSTRLPGMWPTSLDASGCEKPAQREYGSSANQQPVPGTDGTEMMEAGAPVAGASVGKNAVLPGTTIEDKQQHAKAQVKLDAQAKLDAETAANALGASKAKRQLDTGLTEESSSAGKPEGATPEQVPHNASGRPGGTAHFNLGRVHQVNEDDDAIIDTRTGQDVCLPQGLASSSKHGRETFSLGGMSDSTYEYLPKQYMLLGGLVEQYKEMYLASADAAIKELLFRPMTVDDRDILVVGLLRVSVNYTTGEFIKKFVSDGEHLTCFAGGMFALGGQLFNRPEDVEIGWKLTDGCVWAYQSTTTGIMPEAYQAVKCVSTLDCKWNQTEYWHQLDPYEATRTKMPKVLPRPSAVADALDTLKASTLATTYAGSTATAAVSSLADAASATSSLGKSAALDKVAADLQRAAASADDLDVEDEGTYVVQKLAISDDEYEEHGMDLQPDKANHLNKRQLSEDEIDVTATYSSPLAIQTGSTSTTSSLFNRLPNSSGPSLPIYTPKPPLSHSEYVQKKIEDERLPPGMVKIKDREYKLRPEAIESVWYMYRITNDPYWREVGWDMFTAIDEYTRSLYGNTAIDDVTKMAPEIRDTMESFWLAETLKYFYLLFEDSGKWSLDDWVLNTEAHFFRRPKYEFAV